MNRCFSLIFAILTLISGIAVTSSCSKMPGRYSDTMVFVYMAADNNLASSAMADIQEIVDGYVPDYCEPGERGDVLLLFIDLPSSEPQLMRLYRDRYGVVNKEVLRVYDEEKYISSDPNTLNEVLYYSHSLFPTEHNGLVLWSHGTGWLPEGFYSHPVTEGEEGSIQSLSVKEDPFRDYVKSFGVDGGREMEIVDLVKALPVDYDFILFDACFMGGIEVAYELRNKCDFFIGSAAEVLVGGFPYNEIMENLFRGGESNYGKVCKSYYDYYNSRNLGATVSLVRCEHLERLAQSVSAVMETRADMIPTLDMSQVQGFFRYDDKWFYDLASLMEQISSAGQLEQIMKNLSECVKYKYATESYYINGFNFFDIKTFSGLSTYAPNPENGYLATHYRNLSWNKAVHMIE